MHNETMRDEIENFYNYLQELIHHDELEIPSENYDLVLDIMVRDGGMMWSYYYACHDARCLFWLETYDASYMISELFGVKSPAHLSASHFPCSQFSAVSTNLRMQSIVWRRFIGVSAISLDWCHSANIIGLGITGISFQ